MEPHASTAETLGISRRQLFDKIQQYDLRHETRNVAGDRSRLSTQKRWNRNPGGTGGWSASVFACRRRLNTGGPAASATHHFGVDGLLRLGRSNLSKFPPSLVRGFRPTTPGCAKKSVFDLSTSRLCTGSFPQCRTWQHHWVASLTQSVWMARRGERGLISRSHRNGTVGA